MTISDGTENLIDRFIEFEMIISRRFLASAQNMFGDGL